ncbi:glycosyltransferase family 2 protein [Aliivibrio fischeri]|uniref:glycosyltransferase family 2 protein n=1 Tax=Aliivibrio fischeri TaxID=668 RepID=UPI00080E5E1F|nr:glycosyltransferase family 2 protein [Aliivibrio fischeri]OCH37528.1 hypothetical protein A6D99_13775 [Aliivibrio fischeri]
MISVIVACYNSGNTIEKCLNSILEQDFFDLEIICIDDGSTDNTKELIQNYNDLRVKYYYKNNGGASSAKNLGLKLSKGEYICIIDSDDYISNDSFNLLYKAMISDIDIDAALFDLYFVEKNSNINHLNLNQLPKIIHGKHAAVEAIVWNVHGICLYKRELFSNVFFDESNIHGDELTTRVILSKCNKIIKTKAKYFYVQHDSATTIKFSIQRFGILNNLMKMHNYYKCNNLLNSNAIIYFNIEISRVIVGLIKLILINRSLLTSNEKDIIWADITKINEYIDTSYFDILNCSKYSYRIKMYLIMLKSNLVYIFKGFL